VIPGVDDGAPDLESALDTLRSLYVDGVKVVVATPHLSASDPRGDRRRDVDEAWPRLVRRVHMELPDLELRRGFELLLDTPDADLDDEMLRLGGSRFALVEFHAFTIPHNSAAALARIGEAGYVPLLAHPERYSGYHRGFEIIDEWRAAGALLQVNGGSLIGEYGDTVKLIANRFVSEGKVDVIASDNHARPQRNVSLRRVWDFLVERGFEEQATLLLSTNPRRILNDRMPARVEVRAAQEGFLARLTRTFRGDA